MRFGVPPTSARIFCTLGFQRRFVRRCEWLTFMPKRGRLPHSSHIADIKTSVERYSSGEAGMEAARPGRK